MSHLHRLHPGLALGHVRLGTAPTPVRSLALPGIAGELWVKDESRFGDGAWGGNKVRKLEWIIPEAQRRGIRRLFTVGGIGTHWGLACARYGAEHGLETVLALADQPVDEHVREQWARLQVSPATIHRYSSTTRLKLAAPLLMARYSFGSAGRRRLPWYLPAGGSNPVGTLGYVETALEIAEQVRAGLLPEPSWVVTPVGSGGTTAGLALGFRIAGLRTRVFGAVVNDSFRLDETTLVRLAARTAALLRSRGAVEVPELARGGLVARSDWLGRTYGDPTPAAVAMVAAAAEQGWELEPVYTGKALAAVADLTRGPSPEITGPVLWLNTHGPR